MMDSVFEWVKSIVFYLLLLTVVGHLIPGQKYEKYLRLFTGMLLMILVMKPVLTLFSIDEKLDISVIEQIEQFAGKDYATMDEKDKQVLMTIQEEQMEKEYKKQVEAFAKQAASQYGMHLEGFEMTCTYQEETLIPGNMQLRVSQQEAALSEITIADIIVEEQSKGQPEEALQLKKYLAGYFGMKEENVQVVTV